MKVLVLGGTRFIGRRIVEELLGAGHSVTIVHRGDTEPGDLPDVPHIHADRNELATVRPDIDAFGPDALVDCMAVGAGDTDAVLGTIPDGVRLAVLSSADVYRAFGSLHHNEVTDEIPLDETSPVRENRYPYRGQMPGMDDYEKLDVEERYLARGGTVLRLPMVYGEHDYQRREWFLLRRIVAGRKRVPFGAGNGLLPRGYVGDIARGVRLALETDAALGEILNLAERRTATMRLWAEQIADAAGATVEFVTVPDDALPPDLGLTGAIVQPVVLDSAKARAMLGWEDSDPAECLSRSVGWHLANPPSLDGESGVAAADFTADDEALERERHEKPEA
jgi:nucleoside-diphosphate-sugar epimerase